MKHYVYALLDPRKSGNYKYGEYKFDFEPFYIGISRREGRFGEHLKNVNRNRRKFFKINKLKILGLSPIFLNLKDNLSEMESSLLEIELIETIGRLNKKTGPLTNVLRGGQINNYELISLSLKNIPSYRKMTILQYDINGNLIKEWESARKAMKELNITHITDCARGERKTAGDFIWKYKNPEERIKHRIYKKRKSSDVKNKRKILQYDLKGNFVREFNSILEASEILKIHRACIGNCCGGIYKKAGKFIFKYKD
jgi:hypothetical protein